MVARVSLLVLGLVVLCGGCGTWNDCIVHFEMREPDCPDDPNVLLTELKRELPDDVEIEYFFWREKPNGKRGIVTVTNRKAAKKVTAAVKRNPRLVSV